MPARWRVWNENASAALPLVGVGISEVTHADTTEWLRHSRVSGVRIFAGVAPTAKQQQSWGDGVHDRATFEARRREACHSSKWLNASIDASFAGRLSSTLSAASELGIAAQLVLQVRRSALEMPDRGAARWRAEWVLWRLLFTGLRHYQRQHPQLYVQVYNEPDHREGTSTADYMRRLRVAADALQRAADGAGCTRFLLAPTLTGPDVASSGGWRRGGWAEAVTAAAGAAPGLFDGWCYHTYSNSGGKVGRALAQVRAALPRGMPLHLTEFSAMTHRQFARSADTMDSARAYARLGAQFAALMAGGADGAWAFRLTQSVLPGGEGTKKNGLLRLWRGGGSGGASGGVGGIEHVRGATRGFEVLRLAATFAADPHAGPLLRTRRGEPPKTAADSKGKKGAPPPKEADAGAASPWLLVRRAGARVELLCARR
jgi:hypothetical protein